MVFEVLVKNRYKAGAEFRKYLEMVSQSPDDAHRQTSLAKAKAFEHFVQAGPPPATPTLENSRSTEFFVFGFEQTGRNDVPTFHDKPCPQRVGFVACREQLAAVDTSQKDDAALWYRIVFQTGGC